MNHTGASQVCNNSRLEPKLQLVSVNGLDLGVWDWPGEGTPLVFAHATAFHARLWDPVIRLLPPRKCLAVDMRGHGRSAKPEPPYRWRNFGCDLAGVVRQLGVKEAVGVGHSMGGHAMVQAALLAPECFRALLLIDPTIFPPEFYSQAPFDGSFTLRRKNEWRSPEEMWERSRGRPPFAGWRPEALRAYCEYGLQPENGHMVLACPPPVEASIYAEANAPEANLYAEIPRIAQPVTVLRASATRRPGVLDLSASPTAPDLAAKFQHGRDMVAEGRSHYVPMEDPELVAEVIAGL